MKRRLLSILLVMAMVLSMVPVNVFATESDTSRGDEPEQTYVAFIGETGYETVQAAVDAAAEAKGEVEVVLAAAEITEDITISQTTGLYLTLTGVEGTVLKGMILIDGHSNQDMSQSVTIQNIDFDVAGKEQGIATGTANTDRYACNVTVKDCDFTDSSNAVGARAIYIGTGGSKQWTISGCSVDATMHSLAQVKGVTGLLFEFCNVNSKNGINVNNSFDAFITCCDFNVQGYAVRLGDKSGSAGEAEYILTSNTMHTASTTHSDEEDPAVELRAGAASASVTLRNNQITTAGAPHIATSYNKQVDVNVENILLADNYWGVDAPMVLINGENVAEALVTYPDIPAVSEIKEYLNSNELITGDQALALEEISHYLLRDEEVSDEEMLAVANEMYNVLFHGNEAMTDEQRIEVIGGVYDIIKAHGYLKPYQAQYLDTLEAIIALPSLKNAVSNEKTFELVEFIYGKAKDGIVDSKDAREIIDYIWNTTLALTVSEGAGEAPEGSAAAGSSSGSLTVKDKLAIIQEVMNIIAEDEGMQETYPEAGALVELYEKVAVKDENGKQLIPDDVLIELFDEVVSTVGDTKENPEITDEVITELTGTITNTVLTDPRIDAGDRVKIAEEIAGSLGGMVGGESTEALAPHMEAMNALRARLNASGLLTAEQEGEIVSQVAAMLPAVMAGKQPTQDEIVAVVDGVYNIVFNREDLSVEDKIQIVLITLEVLDEYGYTDDAYAMGYETAKAAGYVAEAVKYVDIAADAIATAKKAVEVFAVEEKYEAVKAALIAELDETAATLAKIEALLAADALSTKDGALSELLKLEGDLNNHIENLKTLAMEIGFVADPYIQAAVDAHNKYAAVVTAVVEEAYKYVAGIDDTYAVIVEEIGKVADQMHPDLGAAVRKYLTEVPADALAILYAHGEEAVNVLIAKAALASGDIENIYNALAPVVEKHGKAIYEIVVDSDATADILAAIDAAYADLLKLYEQASKAPVASAMNADITAAQKYILGLYNTLYPLVMDVVAEVTEYPEYAELTGAAWTALMDLIKVGNYAGEYGAWIAGDVQIMLSEQLLALFANNDEFMQVFMPLFIENVTFVNQFLMDLTDKVTDQIWNTYLQIREVIENMIDTIIEFGKDACNQIKHQLNVLCNNIKDALNEQVNNLKDLVNDLLEKAEDMAKEQLKQVLDLVNQLIAQIEKQLDTLEGIAKEKLQAVYDALLNLRDAINQALSDATNGAINNLMDAINALKKAVADAAAYLNAEAMELINKIVEIIEALYWNATHDYYMVDEASYYVAIGDGTAVSEESYVEKLAEELGVAYNNLAVKGMLVADTYELLEKEAAEIAKADLITVGFGSNSFVNYAIDNIGAGILTGSFAEHDWASAVGAEGVTYVEEILAAIYAELEAQGLGTFEYGPIKADMAQLLTAAIESYAYAAISYATELPEVIDEIHAINPNAVVAIVGMYNPNADMVLDLGETAFDIGEYVDYLVTAANVHNFTYALLTDKAIFVEADEVETVNTETTMDIGAFLVHYMDGYGVVKTGEVMNPSEAGHEYIKTQIREALVLVNPVEIEMTRMILGNELAMQFAFKKAAIIEGVPYEVVITKTYADGRENKVVEIPVSEWKSATIDGEAYYYVSFNGIAAKEMSDDVNVQIVVADKLAVSKVYTDSIRVYANRQLDKAEEAVIKGLYVDMLNYGAAAQTYFGYDAQNLANAELTAEEQGYATKEVKLENKLVAGKNYNASQLNLASSIQLRVKFDNIDASMKAVVSFTNHTGREIEVEVAGSEFIGNGTVVVVDEIVAADYAQDVTIVVYDAAGNKVAEAVDSVASYIARMSDKSATPAIYDAVAKYDAAAYAYLHK